MKNLKFAIIALLSVMIMIQVGCKKDEETPAPTAQTTAWTATSGGQFDYVGLSQSGEMVAINANDAGTLPTQVFYQKENGTNMCMYLNSTTGFPERIYANGAVMVFQNASANMLDVGMVSANGEVEIFRDITFDNSAYFGSGGGTMQSWTSVLNWTGHAMTQGLCVSSKIGAEHASMITAPLTAFSCSSVVKDGAIGGTTPLVTEDVFAATAASNTASTIQSSSQLLALGTSVLAMSDNTIQTLQDKITLIESTLGYGYGDVQVTLTWNTTADLDLWVTDPAGEKIYYGNPSSESGGELDVDDPDGFGPENIFWTDGAAPSGQYLVQLDHYSGESPTNYIILVQTTAGSQQYTGTITTGQTLDIVTFSVSKGAFSIISDEVVVSHTTNKPAKK